MTCSSVKQRLNYVWTKTFKRRLPTLATTAPNVHKPIGMCSWYGLNIDSTTIYKFGKNNPNIDVIGRPTVAPLAKIS